MDTAVASYVGEVPVAALVRVAEADSRLLLAVERDRCGLGEAPMGSVNAVDRRARIPVKSEERADAIHADQHTKRPAGKTGEADEINIPATTYFPRRLPPEYLRRWRA